MKNISQNLLNRLPAERDLIFRLIHQSFSELKIPYIIIGAQARDLLMEYCYNISSPRATLDTDLGMNFIMLKISLTN